MFVMPTCLLIKDLFVYSNNVFSIQNLFLKIEPDMQPRGSITVQDRGSLPTRPLQSS